MPAQWLKDRLTTFQKIIADIMYQPCKASSDERRITSTLIESRQLLFMVESLKEVASLFVGQLILAGATDSPSYNKVLLPLKAKWQLWRWSYCGLALYPITMQTKTIWWNKDEYGNILILKDLLSITVN